MLQDNVRQIYILEEHGPVSMEEVKKMPSELIAFLLQVCTLDLDSRERLNDVNNPLRRNIGSEGAVRPTCNCISVTL